LLEIIYDIYVNDRCFWVKGAIMRVYTLRTVKLRSRGFAISETLYMFAVQFGNSYNAYLGYSEIESNQLLETAPTTVLELTGT